MDPRGRQKDWGQHQKQQADGQANNGKLGQAFPCVPVPAFSQIFTDDGVAAGAQHGGDGNDHIDDRKYNIQGRQGIASQKA